MVSRRVQALLDQLRAQGIQDEQVLNALAAVPRENSLMKRLNKSLGQYRLADRSGADNFAAVYGGANDRITRADAAVAGAGNWHWFGISNGNPGASCPACLLG